MIITKSNYINNAGNVNLGRAFESEINQIFSDFKKSDYSNDIDGIDGTITYHGKLCKVQLKCGLHSDGGLNAKHGYSVVHCTTQRKLLNVDYLIIALPEVIDYRRYKLNHSLGIVYVISRPQAVKRKLFEYNDKGEIYFPKQKRLILDRMVKDGYADPVDIITII